MEHLNSDELNRESTPRDRARQSRLNGARSTGPTSEEGKQISSRNAFKTGLWAKTLYTFPLDVQLHYHQILEAYHHDYQPADAIEADLLSQLAFNRMRYHHFLKIEGEAFDNADLSNYPVPLFDHLRRTIEGLERSYLRTLKTLEDRRRHNPQLAQPSKIVVEWIDPRTGEPWRPEKPDEEIEETNPTPEPQTEQTKPPCPTNHPAPPAKAPFENMPIW
ncbi:MAG: hypothetical protein C0506_16015 [Anaerolinea sp.]|nr:hypothetical protein [Anaerolinea sp.]